MAAAARPCSKITLNIRPLSRNEPVVLAVSTDAAPPPKNPTPGLILAAGVKIAGPRESLQIDLKQLNSLNVEFQMLSLTVQVSGSTTSCEGRVLPCSCLWAIAIDDYSLNL